ncbi:MAG: UDP-N-acetylglucosamine 4,6-dehydratase (inverting) [Candidatus Zixiibacteriota bacterium]
MLNGKGLLVTGGTGSFGKALIGRVLRQYPGIRRLVIYSRDELKQFEMRVTYPEAKYPQMRFFIGDVRDQSRLSRAMEGIDFVVHAAALKQVPACEYNPFEAIKTNIGGAQNVVESAMENSVQGVVALSTDKAAAPINLYGATKLCSDKLFVSANNHKGERAIRFSVVRYGNVMGSRGSVIPFFMSKRTDGVLPITDNQMTRFNITLDEGVDMVLYALDRMWGGEIFVPKLPSYRICEMATAIAPDCRQEVVGIRPGEKLHEQMITETDAFRSVEFDNYYVILPSMTLWDESDFLKTFNGSMCQRGFSYSSGSNDAWLSVEEIRQLIRQHIDPDFSVGDTGHSVVGRRTLELRRPPEQAVTTSRAGTLLKVED